MRRSSYTGAVLGGSLGLVLILFLTFRPLPEGADDGCGPMFYAIFPFLAFGFVAFIAMLGSMVGLMIGFLHTSIARVRNDRSTWEPSRFHEKCKPPYNALDEL